MKYRDDQHSTAAAPSRGGSSIEMIGDTILSLGGALFGSVALVLLFIARLFLLFLLNIGILLLPILLVLFIARAHLD
jgi:hypothetical protein